MRKLSLYSVISSTLLCLTVNGVAATTPPSTPATKPSLATASSTPNEVTPANDSLASDEALFSVIDKSESAQTAPVDDPLQGYNRRVYKINDSLDRAIAKPVARAYNYIMPEPLYGMINNFYVNIDTVPSVANDFLQANFYEMSSDAWRLLINTTIGLGGAFDIASHMGLPKHYNDFGLTLGRWGWVNSSYFIIPILGPSTIRDAGGRFVSYELSVYPWIQNFWVRWGIYGGSLLNQRAQLLKYQAVLDQASIDPYVFMRDAYLQRRSYQLAQENNAGNPYTATQMKKMYDPMYLYSNN